MRVVIFPARNQPRDWRFLGDADYHLTVAESRPDLERSLRTDSFDLALVECDASDSPAIDAIAWMRSRDDALPIVVSLNRQYESEIIRALNEGADECICTGISDQECLARIRALLRRGHRPIVNASQTELYGFRFNRASFQVETPDQAISLTEKEFDLAYFFFRNLGRVLSRDHISLAVWGRSVVGESRSLDTHMSRIRRKLQLVPENGFRLGSVYTRGYRLEYLAQAQPDTG